MSKALIAGINQVATDKGLDREVIFTAIEAALVSAYKRNYGSVANVSSEVDRVTGDMRIFAEREVVEELFNPRTEIVEAEARKILPSARLGDVIRVQTNPDDFGRIAAQTAKQVILQRIREAERDNVYENFAHQVGEIVRAQVRSIDAQSGAVTVLLDEKHEVLMMRDELIASEKLRRGDFIKVYVVDVHKSTRGPVIKLSRTHRNLLRRLMEQEIPEVRDGIVEIKSIAREPGARSKASVVATVPGVDPVGSCVGMRGLRIQNIVNELSNEKIDVVEWSADPATYISNALSPAKVNNVILDEKSSLKTAVVVVPDRQLSLAIGKEGQNARLAAKLTGWRIDIKSETEAKAEGLDQIVFERAKAEVNRKSDDLLSVAERILLSEQQSSSNDRLWEVAQSLRNTAEDDDEVQDAFGRTGLDDVFPSLDDERESRTMPALPDLSSLTEAPMPRVTEDAWSAALEAAKGELAMTPEVSFDEEEEAPVEEVRPARKAVVEEPRAVQPPVEEVAEEEAPTAAPITRPDELPQVITADMLRARMAQRRRETAFAEAEIEIPEELLAGIDEDAAPPEEEDIWDEATDRKAKGNKGKKTKAAKKGQPEKFDKKAPKKKKRRTNFGDDDDFGGYF
ncbi:MAG: transcription termination/antitermination protein NusA [Caldilinea sp. CFX5]|nr:transcription termination/antitermination protein NusA [Caldilinea sp. CFX5]